MLKLQFLILVNKSVVYKVKSGSAGNSLPVAKPFVLPVSATVII